MGIKINHIVSEKKEKKEIPLKNILEREINIFGSTFSNKKKEQFYGEVSILLRSGINLRQALDLIEGSQAKEKDKQVIKKLKEGIIGGESFSKALQKEPSFSPFEYHAVGIGEQTGQLGFVTNDLAQFYLRKNEQRRQIISSLTYPVIVLLTALLVVFFMLKYVVPMFDDIFQQNKVELPFLTKLVVSSSSFLQENGITVFFGTVVILIAILFLKDKIWFKKYCGELLLKIPVLGEYARKIYLARFTHTMMLLTNSKIPVINGLEMVRKMITFYPLQHSLMNIETEIVEGQRMSVCFSRHKIFDKKLIALLQVAEESNQTEFVFQKLHDQYQQEVKYQAQTITNMLNPLLTLLVGVIVGVILIAMYLPMFRLSSVIG